MPRNNYYDPKPQPPQKPPSTFRMLWPLFIVLGVVPFILMQASSPREARTPPPPRVIAQQSVRDVHAQVCVNGLIRGAEAGQKEVLQNSKDRQGESEFRSPTIYISTQVRPATTPSEYTNIQPMTIAHPNAAIRIEKVRSQTPHRTKDEGLQDAVSAARVQLLDALKNIEPRVDWLPSHQVIQTEYIHPNNIREIKPNENTKKNWAANGLETDRSWVEVDVEITHDQLRSLRSHDRIVSSAWSIAVILGILFVIFAFLKLDTFTKGYLTLTLSLVAMALIGSLLAVPLILR